MTAVRQSADRPRVRMGRDAWVLRDSRATVGRGHMNDWLEAANAYLNAGLDAQHEIAKLGSAHRAIAIALIRYWNRNRRS